MPIALNKGNNTALTKGDTDVQKVLVGLGVCFSAHPDCEVDASAFLLGTEQKVRSDTDFIFYNQSTDADAAFITLLQNNTEESQDQHNFSINLERVPNSVTRLVFCLTLHDAENRKHRFGMASKVWLRITDTTTDTELLMFENCDFSTETAIQAGELYRRDGRWRFRAIGQGYAGGLEALALGYGVHLEASQVDDIEVEIPLDSQVPKTLADLEEQSPSTAQAAPSQGEDLPTLSKRKRRTLTDILRAEALEIRSRLKPILAQINSALHHGVNESGSRMILDKILQQVLGYTIPEIKVEQNIRGRSADYVISPNGTDTLVIEAKRVGSPLREKQIYQATSYAAHAGIDWTLLTNVAVWRLYKVTSIDKIDPQLVFTIDLHKGISEDAAYHFALISKLGIMRRTQLEKLWQTRRALSTENLISAITNDDVLVRIRNVISRDNGIHLDIADIRAAVERDILKLE